MDLVGHLFGGAAAGKFVATVIGEGGTTGIMETVTQQLGLGLMLSTLLITVPPMAGMWFNGIMASYSGYNAMQGWGNGQPATPPGMNSQQQQNNYIAQNPAGNPTTDTAQQRNIWTTGGNQSERTTTDAMKLPGQPRKEDNKSEYYLCSSRLIKIQIINRLDLK